VDLREKNEDISVLDNRHPWETARFKVVLCYLNIYIKDFRNKPLRILDIGCGDTFFVEKLSKELPLATCWAIDTAFTDTMIQNISNRLAQEKIFVYKDLKEIALPQNQTFDIVLLLDVMEHIENNVSFLKEIKNNPFCGSNTVFTITVPAFQSLFTSHDEFLLHYRRYSNHQLKQLLVKVNLQCLHVSYFFFILLIPRLLKKFLEKVFEQKTSKEKGVGQWKHGKLVTQIIVVLLLVDFYKFKLFNKIGIKMPGLSNIMLCKKPVS